MARIATIDDQKLLQAAREVFLERGFNAKATDIADRAGISSGSIFRRFPDKEVLFLAAMETQILWTHNLKEFEESQDLKAALEKVSKSILDDFRQALPCQIMLLSQKLEPTFQHSEQVTALANFLDKELELGRLRPSLDTTTTAQTIIGMMHYLAWLEIISQNAPLDTTSLIKEFIDTIWKGIIANPEVRG